MPNRKPLKKKYRLRGQPYPGTRYPEYIKAKAVKLKLEGKSYSEINRILNINAKRRAVLRWFKEAGVYDETPVVMPVVEFRVKNKKLHKKDKGHDFYVGRPTALGNPYTHKISNYAKLKVGSREEAVECYKTWFEKQLLSDTPTKKEFEKLVEFCRNTASHVNLVCRCVPNYPCHAFYLAERLKDYL
jgi:hypothetical protein